MTKQKICIQCKEPKDFEIGFCKDLSRLNGKHPICKNCQKINREAKDKGYYNSQKYNKKVYKSTRKKGANPAKRPCLICGTLFDSTDPSDRYCPRCKINKRQSQVFTYTEDDFGGRLVKG